MALKNDFEATNVVSSPFVDEVANPGQRTTFRAALLAAEGKKAPLPVTGEPATEVVRATSPEQLRRQGSKETTILERQRQLSKEAKEKN